MPIKYITSVLMSFFFRGQQFRKAFGQVAELSAFFPAIPIVALSATVTLDQEMDLCKMLNFKKYVCISKNPDRPNIKLICKKKSCDALNNHEDIIMPLLEDLKHNTCTFPLTLMYMPMQYMAEAAAAAKDLFPDTINIYNSPWATIFSSQDELIRKEIFSQLRMENPRIRLVFCTSVLGLGFDALAVSRVIHLKPPRRMNDYMQEIGRAGRNGTSAEAVLYYTASDIACNVVGMENAIRTYCNSKGCYRQVLLNTYGFEPTPGIPKCRCCDLCEAKCNCELCKK